VSLTSEPQTSQDIVDNIEKLKAYLINNLSRELEQNPPPAPQRQETTTAILDQIFTNTRIKLPENLRTQVFNDVLNEILGYGPIQPLLDDPGITEIMVNGFQKVYIEREGKLVKTEITFQDDNHVMRIIDKIILPLGRRIDVDNPTVDARLPDGSRVNAVIPPVAIDGPAITIRKFSKDKLTIQQLIQLGSITEKMADFIQACVVSRLNILISGGTGSGKTTLLNVLSGFIPVDERIVTIEDAAELNLHQDHVVRLETKTANIEGVGEVPIRHLVRNSLRMRPDRIIVGEVRGGEAIDMLQAMNTGHDGSLTTLHANTPRDGLSRLETMTLMSGINIPLRVIREQIASAVDVIIQQSRLKDGSRKVTHVTEVSGMEGDIIVMTDIFKLDQTGIDENQQALYELRPSGIRPMFMDRLEAHGFRLAGDIFGAGTRDFAPRKPPQRRR
jgi:pilus assembly protein CpaF